MVWFSTCVNNVQKARVAADENMQKEIHKLHKMTTYGLFLLKLYHFLFDQFLLFLSEFLAAQYLGITDVELVSEDSLLLTLLGNLLRFFFTQLVQVLLHQLILLILLFQLNKTLL